jgi:purine-nucleoside/S-methyl-5'-thioadenosine phosphorylase / adenosine deaminase
VIHWEPPGPYRIAFTTRVGGVSDGPYASLNLARRAGDDPERVDENRRRACAAIGADSDRLAMNFQRHTALVHRARPGSRGKMVGDGLWTDEPAVPVLALAADCLPIALVRTKGKTPAVGVLHAGWRGLLAGILEAGVAALGGTAVAAAVGPSIGPCCYEVGDDVAAPFRARFGGAVVRSGRVDLSAAAEQALLEAGCSSVERFDLCTSCRSELFFSYRRDGEPRGGQGVIGHIA